MGGCIATRGPAFQSPAMVRVASASTICCSVQPRARIWRLSLGSLLNRNGGCPPAGGVVILWASPLFLLLNLLLCPPLGFEQAAGVAATAALWFDFLGGR